MIQRLQTLWLLFAAILAFATFNLSFFSGSIIVDDVKQFQRFTAMSNIFLMICTGVVCVGSLVTIFLYKNRDLQFKVTLILFAVSILNLLFYYMGYNKFTEADRTVSITAVIALVIPLLLLVAARGIYQDHKLVKSVDRLR
ncbi:MAG: DUF4293 domain-containing protein [Bacteroidota bacterium]